MKKIFIIILFLIIIVGCKKDKIDNINTFNLYCYKEYDNYEEYVSFEYNNNIINSMFVTYIFDYDISGKINSFNSFDISFKNNSIEYEYKNIKDYKKIKQKLIDEFDINEDNFDYINGQKIDYRLFRDYLKDYSCE